MCQETYSFSINNRQIHLRRKNRSCGFSILETLVSVVIIGIAIAGITELLWINTSWNTRLQNKFDNFYAGKQLLRILSKDFRSSCRVKFNSNATEVTLVKPKSSEVNNGFIKGTEEITYEVVPDSTDSAGSYLIQIRGGRVLLRGVVGPKVVGKQEPQVFQYLEKDVLPTDLKYGIRETASNSTGSVVVNIELRRADFGGSNITSSKSDLVMRSEYMVRNGALHGR